MSAEDRFFKLVDQLGAKEVRGSKHRKFKLPDGRTFAVPRTPSDHRAWENMYHDLRAFAGLRPEHRPGQRRAKKRSVTGRLPSRMLLQNVPVPETSLGKTIREQLKPLTFPNHAVIPRKTARFDYGEIEKRVMGHRHNAVEVDTSIVNGTLVDFKDIMDQWGVKRKVR